MIKFGGTSLATPELVRDGARHVARLVSYGEQIAVVVSAPGNTTTELIEAIHRASGDEAEFGATCNFAALGEEQSVHMMVAALRSMGTAAQPYLPRDGESWPIIADLEDNSPLAMAKVNEERPFNLRTQQTVSRFRRFVLPQLRVGTVPVISGFFAIDSAERVVTLGRGGSDITAFIVATQINAGEVVIVTDVQGVLSADPRLAENPRLLEQLSTDELEAISGAGARVLHPRSLKYRTPDMKVRLLDYRELDKLEESGTSVFGRSETILYRNPQELSMLTVVGEMSELAKLPEVLVGWMTGLESRPVASARNERYACFLLPNNVAEESYGRLHKVLNDQCPAVKSLSLRGGIGELRLRSAKFIEEAGVLAEVTGILANARINIVELITSLTDISVFVNYQDLDRAEMLLSRVLERFAD